MHLENHDSAPYCTKHREEYFFPGTNPAQILSPSYNAASSWGISDYRWSHISQGIILLLSTGITQLELPHKTTINCCSLIKCVFYYWRHYEIFVSDENKKSHSFCCKAVPDSLWLGLMLHLPLDSFTLNSRSVFDTSFGRAVLQSLFK